MDFDMFKSCGIKKRISYGMLLFAWLCIPAYADFNSAMLAYQQEDYSLAMTRLRPLAELGNADAQYNIGVMYLRGQDWVEAYACLKSVLELI